MRQECYQNFWKFAKSLLDKYSTSQTLPQFSPEACAYFTQTYHSSPHEYVQPNWMPSPACPILPFDEDPITLCEIESVVKHTRIGSSPSPLDQVSYRILKKCPSLSEGLLDLYQSCWSSLVVPNALKIACIKLIGKSTAKENPEHSSNFRPIALTSCIGKIFTTILKNRWLKYMLGNGYLDRSVQKAFMSAKPGCIEHQAKLAAILRDACTKHKSLAVCWLDLANAYGSVHHSLINFSLVHHHSPPSFSRLIQVMYDGLSASVMTQDWSTPAFPLQIGVYQGDPLSVVIFSSIPWLIL